MQYGWAKLVNELPMHTQRAQKGMGQTNILCHMRVFCTHIVCYQLKHLRVH